MGKMEEIADTYRFGIGDVAEIVSGLTLSEPKGFQRRAQTVASWSYRDLVIVAFVAGENDGYLDGTIVVRALHLNNGRAHTASFRLLPEDGTVIAAAETIIDLLTEEDNRTMR